MEIKTTEEARQGVEEFAVALLDLMVAKKAIDAEIKELKENAKENGVPAAVVTKVLNKIKASKKKSESEKFEEDTIEDWLSGHAGVDNLIGQLSAK